MKAADKIDGLRFMDDTNAIIADSESLAIARSRNLLEFDIS